MFLSSFTTGNDDKTYAETVKIDIKVKAPQSLLVFTSILILRHESTHPEDFFFDPDFPGAFTFSKYSISFIYATENRLKRKFAGFLIFRSQKFHKFRKSSHNIRGEKKN